MPQSQVLIEYANGEADDNAMEWVEYPGKVGLWFYDIYQDEPGDVILVPTGQLKEVVRTYLTMDSDKRDCTGIPLPDSWMLDVRYRRHPKHMLLSVYNNQNVYEITLVASSQAARAPLEWATASEENMPLETIDLAIFY